MHIPNSCITCGNDMGFYANIFIEMLKNKCNKASKELNIPKQNLFIDPMFKIECKEILDMFRVESMCCRISLTTGMNFYEYLPIEK